MMDLYFNDSIASLLFQSWKSEGARDRELIERSRFRAGMMYDFLERRLNGRPRLLGGDFTLADCAA
ncbi:MAG: glutathione S-transferase domain-containing protein [Alphaproteobacteria bacterium]|nr:glutathione S-transferase domain-containing protein [Alphaproteobacteria bacterium]